jgi:hypothetical protein
VYVRPVGVPTVVVIAVPSAVRDKVNPVEPFVEIIK